MQEFDYFNSLYKDLISQADNSAVNGIKFISFQPQDIPKYKSKDVIYVIRYSDQLQKFKTGDFVRTQWGKIYLIQEQQFYSELIDCPQLGLLSEKEIHRLYERQHGFKQIKLVRVVKKQVKRIFYDFQFDQTGNGRIIPISVGMTDQHGNQLYAINKEYDWNQSQRWLKKNVMPYTIQAPDYIKMTQAAMKDKILEYLDLSPKTDLKLYGYYSAYDHVVLCKMFGTMTQLPEGMPMYTYDLKQYLDYFNETPESLDVLQGNQHSAIDDARFNLKLYKAIKQKYSPKYI